MANDDQAHQDESEIKTVRVDPVEVRAAAEAMKADLEAKAHAEMKAKAEVENVKTVPVDPKVVRAAVDAMKAETAPEEVPPPAPFKGIFIPPARNLHDN